MNVFGNSVPKGVRTFSEPKFLRPANLPISRFAESLARQEPRPPIG